MTTDLPMQPDRDDAPRQALGRRIAATLIDLAPLTALFVVMVLLFGHHQTTRTTVGGGTQSTTSFYLPGIPFLIYLLLHLGYYTVCEGLTGKTLGKALLGLRVVLEDRRPMPWSAALVRTVLRLVDGLPVFYLVGSSVPRRASARSVSATGRRRRSSSAARRAHRRRLSLKSAGQGAGTTRKRTSHSCAGCPSSLWPACS